MTDLDKVIRAKEYCMAHDFCESDCPYDGECAAREFALDHDVLALLKEKQAGGKPEWLIPPSEREEPPRKVLWMGGADLCMAVRDDETQEDAEDRLLEQLADAGVDLIGWNAAQTSLDTYVDGEAGEDD